MFRTQRCKCVVVLQHVRAHMLLMVFLLISHHSHTHLQTEHILNLSIEHQSQFIASDKETALLLEAVQRPSV